jgi:citrate lyase subunit beta/citryl-CoA lyase
MSEIPARLERSMLFVPGTRWSMIEKAAASAADAVCIDLEDSVPAEEKAAARANAVRAFRELEFDGRTRMFRMNSLDTPFAYRDVVDVVEAAGDRIDLVMLPKAGSPEDVRFVATLLAQIEQSRGFAHAIRIEAQIESAAGFLYAREIAQSSPRLEALIFGPGDYSASLQMPSASIGEMDEHDEAYPGHRWHAVMHTVVAAARANGLRAIDGPFAGYRDAAGFERSCKISRALGFDGKQCIHPMQIDAANRMYTPADAEVARAEEVLRAYDDAAAAGRGAASLNGRMIDAASIRMARVAVEKRRLCAGRGARA